MMPGMNPRQLEQMMRSMGMKSKKIPAIRVIIEGEETNLVIKNPDIMEIEMKGQKTYQISGGSIEKQSKISSDDVKMVMEQAKVDEDVARKALEENNGDIAQAIMSLSDE